MSKYVQRRYTLNLKQIEVVVDNMKYDFTHFKLSAFIDHIECLKRRPILVLPSKFQDEALSAVWVKAETAHYMLYNYRYHRIHVTHSVLHEIAHLMLGHPCHKLDEVLAPELIAELRLSNPIGHSRKVSPTFMSTPEEREAEAFVYSIQQRVKNANRLYELMGQGSSIEALNRYVSPMGFEM
jgi:hypothetical protein